LQHIYKGKVLLQIFTLKTRAMALEVSRTCGLLLPMAVDKSPRDCVRGGDADARLLVCRRNGCLDAVRDLRIFNLQIANGVKPSPPAGYFQHPLPKGQ